MYIGKLDGTKEVTKIDVRGYMGSIWEGLVNGAIDQEIKQFELLGNVFTKNE